MFIQQLLLNLYVDDLSNIFNNVEDSFKFYEVSKKCLAEASFKLHRCTISFDLFADELTKLIKLNESDTTEMHSADDETYVKDSQSSTMFFDPFGLICTILLQPKS